MKYTTFLLAACLITSVEAKAEPAPEPTSDSYAKSEILWIRRVAPLLREKCSACHGADPDAIEGSLDLSTMESMLEGGDRDEPAVVPNHPEASGIYLAARRDHDDWSPMPPKEAEQLTDEQLSSLQNWIATGAAWPDKARQQQLEAEYNDKWSAEDGIAMRTSGGLSPEWTDRKYQRDGLWAYAPVERKKPPAETSEGNAIDFFVKRRLPEGLQLAPPASRRDLLRRATFDLLGLPPKPEEVDAFVADPRPVAEAFADVVDRLLNSPHYGERMAQHWLDVVRYADSSGFANDYERGNAWRYRDYVVRSFNSDKPFDQFALEQIAGDELMPGDSEGLVAVGFLRMGPWELTGMEVARIARQRFLDDVTNGVGETFLGHSLQCARCHDHKFDPVPTRDYYSIQAVFATTQLAERHAAFLPSENVDGFDEQQYLERRMQAYSDTLEQLQQALLENSQTWFDVKLEELDAKLAQAAESGVTAQQAESIAEQKVTVQKQRELWDDAIATAQRKDSSDPFGSVRSQFIKRQVPQDQFPPKLVGLTPDQIGNERVARKGLQRSNWEMDRYQPVALSVYNGHTRNQMAVLAPQRIPQNRTKGELETSYIRTGGDPFAEGEQVLPGTLSVIDDCVSIEIPNEIEGRRTKFAEWVASPHNPLTTRVIVNRVWQWHFGKAIAGNPNNFGSTGGQPTHPDLLDYLATRFVDEGWSIKSLHRHVMASMAYQRSAAHPNQEQCATLDPLGNHYAVFQPRRLTAEEIRDAMLAVTGELNPKLGGIPCRPEINIEVAMQPRMVMGTFAPAWTPNPNPHQRHRRSLYAMRLRGLMYPLLEVFNAAAPDFSCERREASTVTPQVFSLFNGQNSYSRALALADRVWNDVATTSVERRDEAAVVRCFDLAFGREPSNVERQEFLAHWHKIEQALPQQARPSPPVPLNIERRAVEENTGERFTFEEPLFSNEDFVRDLQPSDVDRHVRALADLCLVILNSNEFVYVY